MIAPFNRDGEWLRCQLHSHTTNSDGEATPDGLVEHYARAGFDVLAITDHWHITTAAHDELVLIPSSELSAKLEGRGDFDADVLAYGIRTSSSCATVVMCQWSVIASTSKPARA